MDRPERKPEGIDYLAWLFAWIEIANDCPPAWGLYESVNEWNPPDVTMVKKDDGRWGDIDFSPVPDLDAPVRY